MPGRAVTTRRIQAGFDIDVYGNIALSELPSSLTVHWAMPLHKISLHSRRKFQPERMMRIRNTHSRGWINVQGYRRRALLRAILRQFDELGVRSAWQR